MSPGQIQNLPPEEVYEALGSRASGLSADEVAARLREVGPNTFRQEASFRGLRLFAKQLTNFFTLLLFASAGLCGLAHVMQPGERMNLLGWALLGVSLLNAVFAFVQEYRAERAMEALRGYLPTRVRVRREGKEKEVLAEELVPGDVLLLAEGNRIPADARLVISDGLLAHNAALTGESRPVALHEARVDTRLVDSSNVAFAGCSLLQGTGEAVVFASGHRTEFGKIAALSRDIPRPPSPLELETARMVRVLTVIAVGMGLAFFFYGVATGRSVWVNLVFMLGIIVANVPEGLLPTFTLALAMGSQRMARKNVLVKGLSAVEALGSVNVICSDKTGTLTLNRLTVTHCASPAGDVVSSASATRLLEASLVASNVRPLGGGSFGGDPMDVAVAQSFAESVGPPLPVLEATRRRFAIDVKKRREAGLLERDGRWEFVVKGAWEALRPMISEVARPDGARASASEEELILGDAAVRTLASQGLRVIAVGARWLPEVPLPSVSQDELEQDLTLLGFLGLEDPLRVEVPDAVARCRAAGIRVLLVTGDHPATAEAIARRAGILESEDAARSTVTGIELEELQPEELTQRLEAGATIFARTTPEQKLKIVRALQRAGNMVAMTGDGVNDAPALKAADVGVAMGKDGTDVAREAAAIILLDDNFASIVDGIAEGRTVFRNIRKFTNYVLVSNGPEIIPYLLFVLFPVPLALTVIQILCIDLGTDIVPSMALGQEPPEPDVLETPPQRVRLLDLRLIAHSYLFLGLIQATYSLTLFFLVLSQGGWVYGQELASVDPLYRSATGAALASIILMQIGNLIGRRYERRSGLDGGLWRNRLIVCGVALEILFAWAVLYLPPVQHVLGTGPVEPHIYALAWLGVPLIFVADWLRKRILLLAERRESSLARTLVR